MHRRARHFKPKSVGASLGFDARFISGLSDGSAVSTWYDLSGNANDAVESTSAKQPTYKTNVSGGCPGVKFDGTNDDLVCGSYVSLTSLTFVVAINGISTDTSVRTIFYQGNHEAYSPWYNWIGTLKAYTPAKFAIGNYNDPNDGSAFTTSAPSSGSQQITGLVNDSGTTRAIYNGVQEGTSTSQTINISSSARPTFGKTGTGNIDYFDGHILCFVLIPSAVQTSLRKRIEHSNGFSFKIACS